MKGDRVEIVIDAGSGTTRTYEVTATRAGRRVNVTHGRGVVEVSEVTRGGSTVRTARFLANRVLALVEHPAADDPVADEITPSLALRLTPTLHTAFTDDLPRRRRAPGRRPPHRVHHPGRRCLRVVRTAPRRPGAHTSEHPEPGRVRRSRRR